MRDIAAECDYVIVGAGSAGCVLANRLSGDAAVSVVLLEAGGSDRHLNVTIPAAFPKLFRTARDWAYSTEEEPGMKGRSVFVPRGRMVGGSSSMNAMIYIRGRGSDYDGWAASGCTGWEYDDVLPLFRRSERNTRLTDEYHGTGGELTVGDLVTVNPLSEAFVESCIGMGMPANDDFNGATQVGAGLFQVTQLGGRRVSTAKAFLRPARRRRNLSIITKAHATEVLIDRETATGVAYVAGGRRHVLRARREVILAAGAINSPQLLMLSGIGPADHLAGHGITPVMDLPVGRNLQDHPATMVVFHTDRPVSLADAEKPPALLEYAVFRRGMLSSNVGEAGCFVASDVARGEPDLQFHFGPAYFVEHGFQTYDDHAFTLGPTLVNPASRGSVELRSADPFAAPRIFGNHLAERADVEALVAGVRMARDLAHTAGLDHYRGHELHPGPAVTGDGEMEEYVRQVTELLYHPAGTCAMGASGESVVDPELRVNGIARLRVADASAMPRIVSGNLNAPTIMIAEKLAELLTTG